jgi:hypothetical protein
MIYSPKSVHGYYLFIFLFLYLYFVDKSFKIIFYEKKLLMKKKRFIYFILNILFVRVTSRFETVAWPGNLTVCSDEPVGQLPLGNGGLMDIVLSTKRIVLR